MPTTVTILVVGTNKDIIKTIAKLIDKEQNWHAVVAHSLAQAHAACAQQPINLLLIGAGLLDTEEEELKNLGKTKNIPVVSHYGGGSGLLYAEIKQIFFS